MEKIIFAIFAHPDDESFGPSGTLIKEIKENHAEVHLITFTAGELGANPDNFDDLGAARLKEWHKAGQLIGAKSQHHLGYIDGSLSNSIYLESAEKILAIVQSVLQKNDQNTPVEFMSSDLNGISGHIDHIVAARVACYVFYKLKATDPRYQKIRLSCISIDRLPNPNTNWLYMEAGRTKSEISEVIDAREYQPQILKVMQAHQTQRSDYQGHIENRGKDIGLDYFITLR